MGPHKCLNAAVVSGDAGQTHSATGLPGAIFATFSNAHERQGMVQVPVVESAVTMASVRVECTAMVCMPHAVVVVAVAMAVTAVSAEVAMTMPAKTVSMTAKTMSITVSAAVSAKPVPSMSATAMTVAVTTMCHVSPPSRHFWPNASQK